MLSLLCLCALAGCGAPKGSNASPAAAAVGAPEPEPELRKFTNEEFSPSLVQVLAHRDRYHGQKIQVKGYLHVRSEDTSIYLSKDDADHGITQNGFWVTFDGDPAAKAASKELDGKYVLVEGTFDKDGQGHMALWQGTINKVARVYELRRRD
jgi:hypothetical protein